MAKVLINLPMLRDISFWLTLLVSLPAGLLFGLWSERLIHQDRALRNVPPRTSAESRRQAFGLALAYVMLCSGLFVVASLGGQFTPEVQPTEQGFVLRRIYHQLLIGLILVATAVDWDGYVIPDQITFPGMFAGLLGAFVIGDAQLIHLWVDWSYAVPDLRGPYFPDWFATYQHWHGLAWSAAGLIVGAGLVWTVRAVSSSLMRRETLGFGDVTFLAMIGSFLGWQPTVCAFLLAPLLGMLVGLPLKLLTNKPYLPYGPFLGAGALAVLFAWGPLWNATKRIFGDAEGLMILFGLAAAAFVVLLGLMRIYRSIPGKK